MDYVIMRRVKSNATPESALFLYHRGKRGRDSLPSFPHTPILLGQFGHLGDFLGGFPVLHLILLFSSYVSLVHMRKYTLDIIVQIR